MIFIYITSTDPVQFAVMFRTHSRSISKIYDLPSPLCRSHSREPFCHMSHHTPKLQVATLLPLNYTRLTQ